MDIRGSTCNLCGVLSLSELPVFQHTYNQDFSACDTTVKIPVVCVHVCLRGRGGGGREREGGLFFIYLFIYLYCSQKQSYESDIHV